MSRRFLVALIAWVVAFGTAGARADLIVTLEAKDADGSPIVEEVPSGSQVFVDVLLSVDGVDVPLSDVRSLQFDFGASSSTLDLGTFTWEVEPNAYGFQAGELPTPYATSLLFSSDPDLLNLNEDPVLVAAIEVTVNASGTLDAVGLLDTGQMSLASLNAGFTSPVVFSLAAGNVSGGTLLLSVTGSGDADGDGVPDPDDAFPDDATESVDTDDDGVGNNADSDDDDDGVDDVEDDFPLDLTETQDSDEDGVGDNGDAFPLDQDETTDTDDDGVGNNADSDDDGDGVEDTEDAFPLDSSETADSDGDGIGDNADEDSGTVSSGGRGFCGVAMLQTFAFISCGLAVLRFQQRRRCVDSAR